MGTGTETSVWDKSDRNEPSQHLHLHRDVPRDLPDRRHRLNEDDGLRCPFHGVHDRPHHADPSTNAPPLLLAHVTTPFPLLALTTPTRSRWPRPPVLISSRDGERGGREGRRIEEFSYKELQRRRPRCPSSLSVKYESIIRVSGSGSSPKQNNFVLLTHPTAPPSSIQIHPRPLEISCSQTGKQTNKHTGEKT